MSKLNRYKVLVFTAIFGLANIGYLSAQTTATAPPEIVSMYFNPLFIALAFAIIMLCAFVVVLAKMLPGIIELTDKMPVAKKSSKFYLSAGILIALIFAVISVATKSGDQKELPFFMKPEIGGLDNKVFYLMFSTIVIETIIALVLVNLIKGFLATTKTEEEVAAEEIQLPKILDKLNASVEIENEADILLDHNYDGIKELDNDLPPWWKYGFYLTIVVAIIYLFNFHVLKTGDLQGAEFKKEMAIAEAEKAEFMKNAANNVDELTVKFLNNPSDIESGKQAFISNCAVCHGKEAEGLVGPNFVDDYWIHGGSIQDIFKSIKYGWPDKGMKAWQEDLSPMQIAQIASYIKSVRGTNPPNQKAKQGDLYVEAGAAPSDSTATVAADSATVKVDSAVVVK